MPERRLIHLGALLCGASLLAGCVNHLPQRSEQELRTERRLVDHALYIDIGSPEVLQQPRRAIRVRDQKSVEVTAIEVSRSYDRYTPYQPWRELYEVPLGAVAVVAGVGANLLNVVALGRIPENATRDWISYGFAGLNPFLNVESNGRAQQSLASLEERPGTPQMEYVSLPWAESPVLVEGAGERHELLTDRNGILYFDLLDGPFPEARLAEIDRLQFSVEDTQDGARALAELRVSPELSARLDEAHGLIFDDLESDDVARWVERVKRLAQLGFEEEASELELSLLELTRHDAELQREFLDRLARATGRHPRDPGEDG